MARPFALPQVEVQIRSGGVIDLVNRLALPPALPLLPERLDYWSCATPHKLFLAEPVAGGWRGLSYAQTADAVNDVASRLWGLPLSSERPLMAVARNSLALALAILAALRSGLPIAIVSPACLREGTGAKLRAIAAQLTPGVILGDAVALETLRSHLGTADAPIFDLALSEAGVRAQPAMSEAPTAETVAKILFTSGSTGQPKGVINTHGMLASNMAGLAQVWPLLLDEPPVMLDWLPWNHVFGGNCSFNLALYFGGTLHIDDGNPTAGAIQRTVAHLKTVSPTIYFNVPAGYEALLPALEQDADLSACFFRRLRFLFAAGAALSGSTARRLRAAADAAGRPDLPILGGWGSTETAPFSTVRYFDSDHFDNVGLPMPDTTIRMIPSDRSTELRVRGPNVTPGYWRDRVATASAFDDDGFYRIGDCGRLADPDHPARGIRYDGRLVENFKLASGTWVNAGLVRSAILSAMPSTILEAVVCGEGRPSVGVLLFVAPETRPPTHDLISDCLAELNRRMGGGMKVHRFLLVDEPPSAAAGEVTEKGSINRRALFCRRATTLQQLFVEGTEVPVEADGDARG